MAMVALGGRFIGWLSANSQPIYCIIGAASKITNEIRTVIIECVISESHNVYRAVCSYMYSS